MLLVWVAAALPVSAQTSAEAAPHITPRLVAESDVPAAGSRVAIAFEMETEPGWHGYWENPGDAGLGIKLHWDLPDGVTAAKIDYPVPETLLVAGIMNHVYEESYAVLGALSLSPQLRPGTRLPIGVKMEWLACTDEICVPESARLTLDLKVGDGAIPAARRTLFDGYRARLPRPLNAEARYARDDENFRLAIPFPRGADVSDPWFFALTDGAVDYAAPQKFSRSGDLLILNGKAGHGQIGKIEGLIKTGPHRGFLLTAPSGTVPPDGEPVGAGFAQDKPLRSGLATVALALGGAILGGLLLNIMPCVFPILSLKALSLAKSGGGGAAARRDALAYMVGAVVTCLALGGVLLGLRAGGEAVGWAFQLQRPEIILLLLLLVTAIAFNLAGLFDIGAFTAGDSLAERGGVTGSFWTGALAAFVATPCTGPFMGAALGAALVLPVAAALAIFAGLGLGLALPFLLIAFVPALARWLPKPGRWMATFRHIMAVPMFLTALALVWLLGRQGGVQAMTLGLTLALAVGLLLWWLGAHQRAGKAGPTGWMLGSAALALAIGGMAWTAKNPPQPRGEMQGDNSIPFSVARLAELRGAGKPVFLYFTADWCITCKANEAAAIDRDEVRRAFDEAGVQVMVGDWTNADAEISRFLAEHGRSGVPLYLWYTPGNEAQVLPQILTPSQLTDLAGHRG
ncbi:MAG: protein-disulfide reductase DsbD family protein [Sphingobium sp.]